MIFSREYRKSYIVSCPHSGSGCRTTLKATLKAAYMQPIFGGPAVVAVVTAVAEVASAHSDSLLPTEVLSRTEEHDLV